MSMARKFMKDDTLLSSEQRIEELERKYSILLERIQIYDNFVDISKNNGLSLQCSLKDISKHSEALQNIRKEYDELRAYYFTLTQKHNDLRDSVPASLNKLQENLEKAQAKSDVNIAQLQGSHNGFQFVLSDLQKDSAKKDDFKAFQVYVMELLASQKKDVLEAEKKIKEIQIVLGEMSAKKTEILILVEAIKNDLSDFSKSTSATGFSTFEKIESLKKIIEDIKLDVQIKLDSFKSPQKDPSDMINAAKSEILSKLEAVTLDSNNAMLKSSNSSHQIMILEKKMENINLTLKKLELAR